MTKNSQSIPETGTVIYPSLSRLKKSPRNARRTPHSPADIEALAASIAAKGMIQPLVVEPELDGEGVFSGYWLVTAGEGRRQAQLLRVRRGDIRKSETVRCLVDTTNDAHEISLDENVTRSAMHPADQFEAFQRLAREKGWGAEEIAARFGVTPLVVRQRLRLAAVSPALMAAYRTGEMSLEQLMAFTVTEDHARQEGVWSRLSWSREPAAIRRLLMEDRVSAHDRRAVFVGVEAYEAAGGLVERDLFAQDGGGWFADPELVERLALDRLRDLAEGETAAGWKWAEAVLDDPQAHGWARLYPKARTLPDPDAERLASLEAERDRIIETAEVITDEARGEIARVDDDIEALEALRWAYDPADMARSGVFVVLAHDGRPRFERGFIRDEDRAPEPEEVSDEARDDVEASDNAEPEGLPDRIVADLTAHRTAAMRFELGERPEVALLTLVHAMAAQVFYPPWAQASCLEFRADSAGLGGYAPGLADSPAEQALEARHARWAGELPQEVDDLWIALGSFPPERRMALLAHCVALTLNGVQITARARPRARGLIERLAEVLGLDMGRYWTATADGYFGRLKKVQILAAVREGACEREAVRLAPMKKAEMAAAAEQLLAGRWLPEPLRGEAATDTADAPQAGEEPEAA